MPGVYDGLTLGAEATAAAEGVEGQLRYDPMSNRPFMAYGEGDYIWQPAEQAAMAERLAARHEVIRDAAHSPAVQNPRAFTDLMIDFLRSVR